INPVTATKPPLVTNGLETSNISLLCRRLMIEITSNVLPITTNITPTEKKAGSNTRRTNKEKANWDKLVRQYAPSNVL
ncbi:955_t:CDS:1, partial [Scutellospora calospora]